MAYNYTTKRSPLDVDDHPSSINRMRSFCARCCSYWVDAHIFCGNCFPCWVGVCTTLFVVWAVFALAHWISADSCGTWCPLTSSEIHTLHLLLTRAGQTPGLLQELHKVFEENAM